MSLQTVIRQQRRRRSYLERNDPEWRAKRYGKRRDIQGLRALAVVAVVVNHLTGHPQGGFVGVDVFFVISGFLITSHLIRDLDRTEGIGHYVGDFYRRRVRRLFPAALLVIGLGILAAHSVFTATRVATTTRDGLWAGAFWANWHFISVGTNYFTANGPTSPFQHYWSLSVEEQFYLVWPLVIFVAGFVFIGRRADMGHRRAAGAIAASVLLAVSLWFAFGQSKSNPIGAYFSTFTRGWELGLGALLACLVPYLRARSWLLTAISVIGTAVIAVSLFTTSSTHGFPAPGALPACIGSGLVLAAASNGGRARNFLLTNPVSVFVGDISYSVYLVHFPVIILLEAKMPGKSGYFYATAVLAIVAASVLLHAGIEKPFLDSSWLLPRTERRHDRPPIRSPRMGYTLLAGLTVGVAAMLAFGSWPGLQAAATEQQQAPPGSSQLAAQPPQHLATSRPRRCWLAKSALLCRRASTRT